MDEHRPFLTDDDDSPDVCVHGNTARAPRRMAFLFRSSGVRSHVRKLLNYRS